MRIPRHLGLDSFSFVGLDQHQQHVMVPHGPQQTCRSARPSGAAACSTAGTGAGAAATRTAVTAKRRTEDFIVVWVGTVSVGLASGWARIVTSSSLLLML